MRKFKIFVLALVAMTMLSGCIFGESWQYKRIGKTNFCLIESMGITMNGTIIPDLCYSKNPNRYGSVGVGVHGVPEHIFWNDSILVVKCSDHIGGELINYYIIKMFGTNHPDPRENYELIQYASHEEYKRAMNALGLKETEMCYTDNSIPWSLHLFD